MQRCTICNTNINNEEDVIFPLSKKNIPGFIWAHYSCILDIVGNLKDGEIPTFKCKTVCKHWKKKGYCSFRKGCFFSHPPNERFNKKNLPYNKKKRMKKRVKNGKSRREGRQRRQMLDRCPSL